MQHIIKSERHKQKLFLSGDYTNFMAVEGED